MDTSETNKNYFLHLITTVILLLLLFATSINIKAQQTARKMLFNNDKICNHQVKEFSLIKAENRLYFKYLILENETDVTYVLEASTDGTHFYKINQKEGFQSPKNTPLLYCFNVDASKLSSLLYYRIKRISNQDESFSKVLNYQPDSAENIVVAEK